jgi:hypothetical protein
VITKVFPAADCFHIQLTQKLNEAAFKELIRAAVAFNLKGKSKPKPPGASGKRAG